MIVTKSEKEPLIVDPSLALDIAAEVETCNRMISCIQFIDVVRKS